MTGSAPPDHAEIMRLRQVDYELHSRTLSALPGAESLIEAYGQVPDFHDSEIDRLQLAVRHESAVRVRTPYPDIFSRGVIIVTIGIKEIIDLELEGFNFQNVLYGLRIRPARSNPKREACFARALTDGDLEIELESTVGIGGKVVCRGVSVAWSKDRRSRNGH